MALEVMPLDMPPPVIGPFPQRLVLAARGMTSYAGWLGLLTQCVLYAMRNRSAKRRVTGRQRSGQRRRGNPDAFRRLERQLAAIQQVQATRLCQADWM